MAKFPTISEMAKDVADEALNNVLYKGKTIKEWIDYFSEHDAVEVVHCTDCVYWDKATVNRKGFLICPASGMEIMAHDYCSYGKRKEDA